MSLYLKFTRADGRDLGAFDEVRRAILSAIPTLRVYQKPEGRQKIADMESRGISLPQALREVFEKMQPMTVAEYGNQKEPLLSFLLGPGEDLRHLQVAVTGNLNAAEPLLEQVAKVTGWVVSEFSPKDAEGTFDDPRKLK